MKKYTSVLTIAVLICLLVLPLKNTVFAAQNPIQISVVSFAEDGNLELKWNNPSGAKSYKLVYHEPNGDLKTVEATGTQVQSTHVLSGIKNDYIYDIFIEIYDEENCEGNPIGKGLLYFLPGISFRVERVGQERTELAGGGFEIGDKPQLKLKWSMPRVWVDNNKAVIAANEQEAKTYICQKLKDIYGLDFSIEDLGFRFNISTDYSLLNSGPDVSSVIIEDGVQGFGAYVSGNTDRSAVVANESGNMSFNLLGRKDEYASMPDVSEQDVLLHDGILPGTVYYMNITPIFKFDKEVPGLSSFIYYKSSPILGDKPYTYTYTRFQLSKDTENNIYAKVYRVNQGSLNMPNMFYEIQAKNDPNSADDWENKKKMDDSSFPYGSDSAITVITGVAADNEIYYRVVAKTDSPSDWLESQPLPYKLAEDTGKPQAPSDISIIGRNAVSKEDGESYKKSTDITISWKKPANWEQIKSNTVPEKDIVFHVLLSTRPINTDTTEKSELIAEGVNHGSFPIKYRKVLYFSSKCVQENGDRLEYTIKGLELFKGEYFRSMAGDEPEIVLDDIGDTEGYPEFLLPNTVYYMQMCATIAESRNAVEDELPDKSVIVSFTTLSVGEVEVPLAQNLRISKNDADVNIDETVEISNYVELQFEKTNINWDNYAEDTDVEKEVFYDIYMGSNPNANTFRMIGTTEDLEGDLVFSGVEDAKNKSIRATVRHFSHDTDAYTAFGDALRPNSTYYFYIKTRLKIGDAERESLPTAAVSVTTIKGIYEQPDESNKRPLAPTDFAIAMDGDNNPMVESTKAKFMWSKKEDGVVYEIICSSKRVEPNEQFNISSDPVSKSFSEEFGDIILDPLLPNPEEGFEYEAISGECQLTIDRWLFPNRLYYFSIRAVDKEDSTKYSPWVSIPVTTSLIEQPEYLELVSDVGLGFFFTDADVNAKADDYKVYLKSRGELTGRYLSQNKYTIFKMNEICYVRILGLEPNTYYDVDVHKGNNTIPKFSGENMKTRDDRHQIEIVWDGIYGYKYEVALKSYFDDDYITLTDDNLQEYAVSDGRVLPYYTEENNKTFENNHEYCFARIKSIPVRVGDGDVQNISLNPNTKYYIKVRAIKEDPVETDKVSYSKYAGPIIGRTEFDQEEYDKEDEERRKEEALHDAMQQFGRWLYWRVDIGNGFSNKLLIKGERMVNAIENSGANPFILDISNIAQGLDSDIIYIPENVIEALNRENKSLVIKTMDSEYSIRPQTFTGNNPELIKIKDKANINGVYYRLVINRMAKSVRPLPKDCIPAAIQNRLDVDIIGISISVPRLEHEIKNKIYNEDTGLLQEKLKRAYDNIHRSAKFGEMANEFIEDIELELSQYIKKRIEGGTDMHPVISLTKAIQTFDRPMMIKMYINDDTGGIKLPYVLYDDERDWRKLVHNTAFLGNSMVFNVVGTGEYAIFSLNLSPLDVPSNYPAGDDIKTFIEKYDMREIFGSMETFYPEDAVTIKEIILLYEEVLGKGAQSFGLTISQKANKYGLKDLLGVGGILRDANRQETAFVVMEIYSEKTGVDTRNLIPKGYIFISDENKIDDEYFKHVTMVLDLDVMKLDNNNAFIPEKNVNRAELASIFIKLLELIGG
ncbi:MAG: ferrous iron transporter A [Clostridium sp.]|nr:ferrous iron transporter A [Clostridium sp.]